MKVLISGGAGFVGAALARLFKAQGDEVYCLDNLKRRGSEMNVRDFKNLGIHFQHGDVRSPSDLEDLPGTFDAFVEASAEPSVHAGLHSSPQYLLQSNLVGTLNCLEFARQRCDRVIFLSTSRVYSIAPLRAIKLRESASRFEIEAQQELPGLGVEGIREDFPSHLPRSLYGATKLASELIIQEYADTYKLKALVNRCGVIAGPGQFGKVDQGVFTLWVANHYFGKALKYTGFGGKGLQVRDLLHPLDLFQLMRAQFETLDKNSGESFNVGGGRGVSTSLLELTRLCQEVTQKEVTISTDPATSPVDIPLYISDSTRAQKKFSWKPQKNMRDIVNEIHHWIKTNEAELRYVFC